MRTLIAEDDPVACRLLEALLTSRGYSVITACDGAEAWEILQWEDPPELVTLDWMMPGMDGLEVRQKIRGMPDRQSTYIIMLTARDRKADIITGFQAGADDYIAKPSHTSSDSRVFCLYALTARKFVMIRITGNR